MNPAPDLRHRLILFPTPGSMLTASVLRVGTTAANSFEFDMIDPRPDGSLYLLGIHRDESVTVTLPGGWTQIQNRAGISVTGAVGYRVGASEPATYTVTASGAFDPDWYAGILRLDGANTADPINASAISHAHSDVAIAPSVQVDEDDTLVFRFFTLDNRNLPDGHDYEYRGEYTTTAAACIVQQGPASGQYTGTCSIVPADETNWVAATVAINRA